MIEHILIAGALAAALLSVYRVFVSIPAAYSRKDEQTQGRLKVLEDQMKKHLDDHSSRSKDIYSKIDDLKDDIHNQLTDIKAQVSKLVGYMEGKENK